MRYYETLYIINPNFEGDRLDAVIKEVGDQITGFDGVEVINHRVWGKKRLAYIIQNHKYGTYVLLQFEAGTGSFLRDFETFLKLDKNIIRSQTIRLDEKPEEIIIDEPEGDDVEDSEEILADENEEVSGGDESSEEQPEAEEATEELSVDESDGDEKEDEKEDEKAEESEESAVVEETEEKEEAEVTEEEASETPEEAEEKKEE